MSGVAKFGAAAVEAIQGQRWLDTPGYKLEHGLALTFNLLGARSRAVDGTHRNSPVSLSEIGHLVTGPG